MNVFVLLPEDFAEDGSVLLRGRRLEHAQRVLGARPGELLRVARKHGLLGTARVRTASPDAMILDPPDLSEPPPPRAAVDLLLALPRPKVLRRVLPAAASLGIDRVVLLNAARVEKSYFSASVLDPAALDELSTLGLEQARDTVPPEILVRERFRPFVEDECADLLADTPLRLVAHPETAEPVPRRVGRERVALAIGPEGGWVPFEIDLLASLGFRAVTLGPRALRVETALAALIGALG